MTFKYINLRADTEQDAKDAAIAAAQLPEEMRFELLGLDEDGELQWRTASHKHAFFPNGARTITSGTYDDEGNELTAPVMDNRFHAILAVLPEMEAAVRQVLSDVGLTYSVEMDVPVGFEIAGVTT